MSPSAVEEKAREIIESDWLGWLEFTSGDDARYAEQCCVKMARWLMEELKRMAYSDVSGAYRWLTVKEIERHLFGGGE